MEASSSRIYVIKIKDQFLFSRPCNKSSAIVNFHDIALTFLRVYEEIPHAVFKEYLVCFI